MKRKRANDFQACDLVLIDANGRSIRAHRALLMDRSEYFARLLNEHNLNELQLNENYLIELIHYLYSHESDYLDQDLIQLNGGVVAIEDRDRHATDCNDENLNDYGENEEHDMKGLAIEPKSMSPVDSSLISGDLEILMHLLVLAEKYSFRQLRETLLSEINYKLGPQTAVTVYKSACELGMNNYRAQTRLMILSWLPFLQTREDFLNLSREAIYDIFNAEDPSIDCNSKLDALSMWWSRNKDDDLTDLWIKIRMSSDDSNQGWAS